MPDPRTRRTATGSTWPPTPQVGGPLTPQIPDGPIAPADISECRYRSGMTAAYIVCRVGRDGRPAEDQGGPIFHRLPDAVAERDRWRGIFEDRAASSERSRFRVFELRQVGHRAPVVGRPEDYIGSNSDRGSVGLPGHCDRCAEVGHVKAHPDMGCGDVGCHTYHPPEGDHDD